MDFFLVLEENVSILKYCIKIYFLPGACSMYINVGHYYSGVADACRISEDGVKDAVWHTFCSLFS